MSVVPAFKTSAAWSAVSYWHTYLCQNWAAVSSGEGVPMAFTLDVISRSSVCVLASRTPTLLSCNLSSRLFARHRGKPEAVYSCRLFALLAP